MSDVKKRIEALAFLGSIFSEYSHGNREGEFLTQLATATERAELENPWFTRENMLLAIQSWAEALSEENVLRWADLYKEDLATPADPRKIGMVMAGNIPMVGLHDLLCVYLSGHHARVKLSSQDRILIPAISAFLEKNDPEWEKRSLIKEGKLEDFDAVIATGSDNSSRYFEYYFGKYPHIIRKNRNGAAVIAGSESHEELEKLGLDIFAYFGMGCRNVSKLYVPEGYDLEELAGAFENYRKVIDHHKYANNYDYQKSILMVNGIPHFDNGYLLLKEETALVSPISVVHFERYRTSEALRTQLAERAEGIQCLAGEGMEEDFVPFGQTQFPALWDYADGVDTMRFLLGL